MYPQKIFIYFIPLSTCLPVCCLLASSPALEYFSFFLIKIVHAQTSNWPLTMTHKRKSESLLWCGRIQDEVYYSLYTALFVCRAMYYYRPTCADWSKGLHSMESKSGNMHASRFNCTVNCSGTYSESRKDTIQIASKYALTHFYLPVKGYPPRPNARRVSTIWSFHCRKIAVI